MNLLNCHQINELLSAYLENELDATTALTVANHIEKCSSCKKELSSLTDISNLVKSVVQQLDKQDLSLLSRASTINDRVRAQINSVSNTETPNKLVEISSKTQSAIVSANLDNIVVLNTRQSLGWRKKLFFSLAASLTAIFLSLIAITYYATATGPLLTGVVRNHHFCSTIDLSGWHKGYPTENLLKANNTTLPKLDSLGIEFSELHPCKVYKTPFLHLMYKKGDKPISFYYGSTESVAKLKETVQNLAPGQLYLQEESGLQIGAITTSKNNLWLVAGELTKEEISTISSQLLINSTEDRTEQSQLFH